MAATDEPDDDWSMLALAIPGVLFFAVAGGSLGAVLSVLLGLPPVMHLISYICGGVSAVLAYVVRLVAAKAHRA